MTAPYRSADQALRFAYDREARDIVKVSGFLADLRGGSVQAKSHLTPFDLLAESAMIISVMKKSLPQSARDIIEIYYTIPADYILETRKEHLARLISLGLSYEFGNVDRWYLCDIVREWAGGKSARVMSDKQWADKLGVSRTTLQHWRLGRNSRKMSKGIMRELDRLLNESRGRMESAFIESGIVEVEHVN